MINENNPKVDIIANKNLPTGCIRSDEQIHWSYGTLDDSYYTPENRIYVSWNEAKSDVTCGFISNGCQEGSEKLSSCHIQVDCICDETPSRSK